MLKSEVNLVIRKRLKVLSLVLYLLQYLLQIECVVAAVPAFK